MSERSARRWFVPVALLPLLVAGCGGTGDTTNGMFGPSGSTTLGGTPSTSSTPGGPQPNAAQAPLPGTAQTATVTNGSLAPLSGSYAGTWTVVTAPAPAPKAATSGKSATVQNVAASVETPTAKAASTAKNTAAQGDQTALPVTLKFSYPTHPSKTDLGDVTGTWLDLTQGGLGRISGTIDHIGLPNVPNAVHIVGKIQFPGGKSQPLVVELSQESVGHLSGATTTDHLLLKKIH